MANIKISELNELETKHDNDLLAIVDSANNETKKIKVETLAPENFELYAIADTQPTIPTGESYYNTTSNKIFTNVDGVYVDKGEPKTGILYIIYSSQTVYVYNNTTLVNIGGSSSYSDLGNKPSINGNILNGNKTNTDLGIPNALNEYSTSTTDGYNCNFINENIIDVVDISSLITKTSNVGTLYSLDAYKKGSRCYLNTIFDLNAVGNVFTIDNSILPKYGEIATITNYDTNTTGTGIARIVANVSNISVDVYGTKKAYAAMHIEWEI